ncbi:MAG: 16S rRNA (guanine(527)-N(7))-methyltransferase RsmG [Thermoflexales bacterium]|nr:16S rRNA (guanine(527)-N(7))-methyltransferase RsmG [Thermoflexales bacterium]
MTDSAPTPTERLSAEAFAARLREIAAEIGVALDDAQAAQFARYRDLLLEWNARFNLTAITDDAGILMRHFADALTIVPALDAAGLGAGARVLDVGTGAGLPGIAIKIARPGWVVTLMDSTAKKLGFCDAVIAALGLREIRTLHARAEEAGHSALRGGFDAVVARAVAALPTLVEYLLPFARVGGTVIAMKGADAEADARAASGAIGMLGGTPRAVVPVHLPGLSDQRALIVMGKARPTPHPYPRQGGKPRAQPLT